MAGVFSLGGWQQASAFGGDRRAENRWYTEQLRNFMWQMDLAVSQRLQGAETAANVKRLQELGKIVRERLVLTRQEEFDLALAQFVRHLDSDNQDPVDSLIYNDFQRLRDAVYRLFRVRTLPSQNPNRELAERLYVQHCAACHGESGRGDGILAKNPSAPMVPAPTNFIDLNNLGVRNAFSYFNSMFAGTENSSMRAFNETLTSHEIWSLAFFLLSDTMRERDQAVSSESSNQTPKVDLDLQALSTQSDRDFLSKLGELSEDSSHAKLDWIRNRATFRGAIPRKL